MFPRFMLGSALLIMTYLGPGFFSSFIFLEGSSRLQSGGPLSRSRYFYGT